MLPLINLPPLDQMDSMQSSCPSYLGLDAGFTPLQSSYTRPDFDPYNPHHYDQHNQGHYIPQPPFNEEQQAGTHHQYGPGVHKNASFISAQSSAALQTSLPAHFSLPNTQHIPNLPISHPAASNGLTSSGSIVPNPLPRGISASVPSCQPPPSSSRQPPQKRSKWSTQLAVLATSSTSVPSTRLPENDDTLPPPINFDSNSNAPPPKKQAPCSKMHPQLVEEARTKTLDELIQMVGSNSKYVRLTAKNQLQLTAAYIKYQRQLYLIAYENKLEIDPCLQYIGEAFNPRVSTNYNNYCRYDPEASKIYKDKSMDVNERNRECGRPWKLLDDKTQNKWKEPKFIQTFQTESEESSEVDDSANQSAHKNRPKTSFKTNTWANKVVADVNKYNTFNGGSHLGEQFLDMFSTENNPCQLFTDYINGHHVVKTLTGVAPPPVTVKKKGPKPREIITKHDKGSIPNNIAFIRKKLNSAIEVKKVFDNIKKVSDELEKLEKELSAEDDSNNVNDDKQRLLLLLWNSKKELYIQAVQLQAKRQPLLDSKRIGTRVGTTLKEKIMKAMRDQTPAVKNRVQEEFQLLAQELARAVGWGVTHYTRFSDSITYISQRIERLDIENNNENGEDVEFNHLDHLNLGRLTRRDKRRVIRKELHLRQSLHGTLMKEWDPHVRWLGQRCQPTNNERILFNDWHKLMDNINSEKEKNKIPTAGEVDAALEDTVLEDTLDDGENANKDWMTDIEGGEDDQGTDSGGICNDDVPEGNVAEGDVAEGDVAEGDERPADTAIQGNDV
ncbi:hypothetical protein PCASD_03901 [Puccinia coronata f. sp. avenae]|uniref:Uncharacterized protein n=1 Tax=Puccinia coronata f. sp. avenae TaxID=200324 RepID=A0A2N5VAP2_9BASI|nr:hypothetical protein PCASD_03901 [Puccinia coronata f. sp. avenae]